MAVILAATLPLKLISDRAPVNTNADLRSKANFLKEYLIEKRAQAVHAVRPNPYVADLVGWSFTTGACQAVALPDPGIDGPMVLRRITNDHTRLVYIYRGEISQGFPHLRVGIDGVMERALWPIRPLRWRIPMVVVLALSGDCTRVLRWDWQSLWA
jgi:hypothetical protein